MKTGLVFNIQRYTIHDGPGIRTEIFLKGCPLSCMWCSNPEGQNTSKEPGCFPKKCIGSAVCGVCIRNCPIIDCISCDSNGLVVGIDRNTCISCGLCASSCPSDALKIWGERYTTADLMKEILKDKAFYDSSDGGVTFSGGEPFLQIDYLEDLLQECKSSGISTCVETTLYSTWENIEKTIGLTDIFISDIKMMDRDKHRLYTGVPNDLILDNLCKLCSRHGHVILRIPLIPGVNDDDWNIRETAGFVLNRLSNRIAQMQILEFMHLGGEKCRSLGMEYRMDGVRIERDDLHCRSKEICAYYNSLGINCNVGTEL